MDAEIIVAIITGACTLAGVIITTLVSSRKTTHQIETNQAVMDYKISELTREVRKHNEFAERIPDAEGRIRELEHDVRDLKSKGG